MNWKRIANVGVVALAIFSSIGVYGMLRGGDTDALTSLALCVTYGVGFHRIIYGWIIS